MTTPTAWLLNMTLFYLLTSSEGMFNFSFYRLCAPSFWGLRRNILPVLILNSWKAKRIRIGVILHANFFFSFCSKKRTYEISSPPPQSLLVSFWRMNYPMASLYLSNPKSISNYPTCLSVWLGQLFLASFFYQTMINTASLNREHTRLVPCNMLLYS